MPAFPYDGLSDFTPDQQRLLRRLIDSHNNVAQQTNADPQALQTPAPLPHSALKVTAGGGYFKAEITPSQGNYRAAEHMIEVSEDSNFTKPHLEHLGASTTLYKQYGEKTLHFRSFCQHSTSPPSEPVYCKNVNGAGGTAPTVSSTQPGLTGYGQQPYNGSTPPKRRSK